MFSFNVRFETQHYSCSLLGVSQKELHSSLLLIAWTCLSSVIQDSQYRLFISNLFFEKRPVFVVFAPFDEWVILVPVRATGGAITELGANRKKEIPCERTPLSSGRRGNVLR